MKRVKTRQTAAKQNNFDPNFISFEIADNDIRGEALEKVLMHLEKTFKNAIEKIGNKIFTANVGEL